MCSLDQYSKYKNKLRNNKNNGIIKKLKVHTIRLIRNHPTIKEFSQPVVQKKGKYGKLKVYPGNNKIPRI